MQNSNKETKKKKEKHDQITALIGCTDDFILNNGTFYMLKQIIPNIMNYFIFSFIIKENDNLITLTCKVNVAILESLHIKIHCFYYF